MSPGGRSRRARLDIQRVVDPDYWRRRVRYLILIYSNPASRDIWAGFSEDQRAEGYRYYAALKDELAASGELIATEALADGSLTRRVSVRGGQTLTSDGPFAEAKELLAGFFLLEGGGVGWGGGGAKTLTSAGPSAEAKELLAGFFLLECESMDRAVEVAARVPEAELGLVEGRPVLGRGGGGWGGGGRG